jgi:hypothetical protein
LSIGKVVKATGTLRTMMRGMKTRRRRRRRRMRMQRQKRLHAA